MKKAPSIREKKNQHVKSSLSTSVTSRAIRVSKRGAFLCQMTDALTQAEGEVEMSWRAQTTLVLEETLKIKSSGEKKPNPNPKPHL